MRMRKATCPVNLVAEVDAESSTRRRGRQFRVDEILETAGPRERPQLEALFNSTRSPWVISDVLRRHGIMVSAAAVTKWRRRNDGIE